MRNRIVSETDLRCPMIAAKDQFVCDENGNRTAVLLDLKRYYELLEAVEDLEAVRARASKV